MVYTAYTTAGRGAARPVTFAFNGGPGAASAFLNLGAIGPKRIQFGAQGDSPSDSAVARDNANSWLDFTDLVFIDPIGTGFSRSLEDEAGTKKDFFTAQSDIEYLSRVVFDWLNKNGRMTSPHYLVGESYGGYRVPRLAYYLQSRLGVGLNGITMVSPYLNPGAADSEDNALSPLPYMISLPSMTAANLERQGKLSPAALADVEAYDRGEFATDLFRGRSDPQASNGSRRRCPLTPDSTRRSCDGARAGSTRGPSCANPSGRRQDRVGLRFERYCLRSLPRCRRAALERPPARCDHRADDQRRGGPHDQPGRLEGRRALQSLILRREPRLGSGQ